MKKSAKAEKLTNDGGDIGMMIEQESEQSTDDRAENRTGEVRHTPAAFKAFSVQPVYFLLGLLIGAAVYFIVKALLMIGQ